MDHDIKDLTIAAKGRLRMEWAARSMPVLGRIKELFAKEKPLAGVRISACLHVTSETANLMEALKLGGASVRLCASNPLSTQDDIPAALLKYHKIPVFAIKGEDQATYYRHILQALEHGPAITMDDGADLVSVTHSQRKDLLPGILAGTEETTTGVIRRLCAWRPWEGSDRVYHTNHPLASRDDAIDRKLVLPLAREQRDRVCSWTTADRLAELGRWFGDPQVPVTIERAKAAFSSRIGPVCRHGEHEGRKGWFIEGAKAWCTFGGRANILALLARTDPDPSAGTRGLSVFIVPKDPVRRPPLRSHPARGGHHHGHGQPHARLSRHWG